MARGGQKFFPDPHGNYLIKKWQSYDNGDEQSGWNITFVPKEGDPSKPSRNNESVAEIKRWYDEVLGNDDPDCDWKEVSLAIFRNNVKNYAAKYRNGPNGRKTTSNVNESDGAVKHKSVTPEDIYDGSNEIVEEVEEEVVLVDNGGNNMVLAFQQCVYNIAQEGHREVGKIFLSIQAISGWYLSLEQDKGDFVMLADEGKTLRLSITGNERLFHKNHVRNLLVGRTDVFGTTYAPQRGVEHTAVAALSSAVGALIPQGQVPSYTFDIPLLRKCERISPNEGLVRKSRGGSTPIPATDPIPAVRFFFHCFRSP